MAREPKASLMARTAMHNRKIAIYFAVLAIWSLVAGINDGRPAYEIAVSVFGTLALGGIALGIIWLIARGMEKTTIYTITNKRVVMRFGIAIPITFQLPFKQITSADVKHLSDGSGTIALTLKEHTKISWPILWPHVRPWKLARPQPSMRAIENVDAVATLLAEHLLAVHKELAHNEEAQTTSPSAAAQAKVKPSKEGSLSASNMGNMTLESAR